MGISPDAITGLVGVGLGTVASGGVQLLLAKRSEGRARGAAFLLVRAELVHAVAMIEGADRDPKAWRVVASPYVSTAVWEQYRETLARDPKVQLGTINAAYISIIGVQSMIPLGKPDPAFVPQAVNAIRMAIAHLDEVQNRSGLHTRQT